MAATATVALFGAGSWGTALAMQLARNGVQVNLWGHEPCHIENLIRDRENREFLPGIRLDDNILPVCGIDECLQDADAVLIAIPSKAFRGFLQQISSYLKPHIS